MTILQAIEQANDTAGIKTFQFATLQEWNSFIDSCKVDDYPLNLLVPYTLSTRYKNNRTKDALNLEGWVLTRIAEDTNNYRSPSMEELYIAPMRMLARKFVRALLETDIIDSEVEDVDATFPPEFMFLSYHTFGVSYRTTIPLSGYVC
jgi:hypothetical protein